MSHRDIFGTFPAPTPPKNNPTKLNYRLGLRYEMIRSQPVSAEDKYKARMAAREQFSLDPKDVSTDQRLLWEMKADDQFLRRRHVRENNAISSEEAASRKVALNVRRAALKLQVEQDKQAHIDELKNKFGKTFYVDRL